VFVSIEGQVRGYFKIETSVRVGIEELLQSLNSKKIAMLSGDTDADLDKMRKIFPSSAALFFNQNPHDKLEYISTLQSDHRNVMMLGDGLNDSGALKQSDVGVAITDDTGVFTPSCDGILQGNQLSQLNKFVSLSRSATLILKAGFVISFFYNIIALSFAVSGHLTPLVAAILMPISSMSVVGFSTLAVNLASHKALRS
jgi:Cu+-exporting ATPase